jgi:hypothetical protein
MRVWDGDSAKNCKACAPTTQGLQPNRVSNSQANLKPSLSSKFLKFNRVKNTSQTNLKTSIKNFSITLKFDRFI